jgi:hypothetical protein
MTILCGFLLDSNGLQIKIGFTSICNIPITFVDFQFGTFWFEINMLMYHLCQCMFHCNHKIIFCKPNVYKHLLSITITSFIPCGGSIISV